MTVLGALQRVSHCSVGHDRFAEEEARSGLGEYGQGEVGLERVYG